MLRRFGSTLPLPTGTAAESRDKDNPHTSISRGRQSQRNAGRVIVNYVAVYAGMERRLCADAKRLKALLKHSADRAGLVSWRQSEHLYLCLHDFVLVCGVQRKRDALQHIVTRVFVNAQVDRRNETHSHRVSSCLSDIQRRLELRHQSQLRHLHGNDLQDGQLDHEHLRVLASQTHLLRVPRGALQVQSVHVAAGIQRARHVFRALVLGDHRVQRGLVQRPVPLSARGLNQRREVALRDVKSREPYAGRLAVGDPVFILSVSRGEVVHPRAQRLLRVRRQAAPHRRQEAVVQTVAEVVQLVAHADFPNERLAQIGERRRHLDDQLVPPLQLLQQHHLAWCRRLAGVLLENAFANQDEVVAAQVHTGEGHFAEDVHGQAADVILPTGAGATATRARLQVDQVLPHLPRGLRVVLDLRVGVQAEHRRGVRQGQRLHHAGVVLERARLRHLVVKAGAREVELLAVVEQEVPHVFFEVRLQHSAIHVVRHAAAVHGVSDEILEAAPRQELVFVLEGLLQVQREQASGDVEVRLVKVVRDVPADLAVLLALLDDGMQEHQHEEAGLEGPVRAFLKRGVVDLRVRGPHVELQAVRRLRDHLKAPLQDTQGELVARLCGEPEAEVCVRALLGLQRLLQRLEPRHQEVAVLQQHPVASGVAGVQHGFSVGPLALTKRQVLEPLRRHALLVREQLDVGLGIRAGAEDEHHRHRRRTLRKHACVVQHRRLHVLLARHADHEQLHGVVHPVRSEAPDGAEPLQRREALIEAARQLGRLRCFEVVPVLPHVMLCLEMRQHLTEDVLERAQRDEVLPAGRGEPGRRTVLRGAVERRVALEEEVDFAAVEALIAFHDHGGHLEAEHELVALEDPRAGVVVHPARDGADHVAQAVVQHHVALGGVQRLVEDVQVRVQRDLVHPHGGGEAGLREVHDRAALGHGHVLRARLADLVLGEAGLLQLALDLHGLGLGLVQRGDEVSVVEDVALRVAELAQQRVFQRHQQLRVLAHRGHQLGVLLLQVRALVRHHHVEQLVGETHQRDAVVDEHRLAHDLRAVPGVAQLGREEQLEAVVPVDDLVAQADLLGAVVQHHVLLEHRVQHGVQLLVDVLEEEGIPELDGQLQVLHEVGLVQRLHREVLVGKGVLDPAHRLLLRVDAQREARRLHGEDAVLDAVVVRGEPLGRPALDGGIVHQHRVEEQVLRQRQAALFHGRPEILVQQLRPELAGEGARVGEEGRRQQTVPDQLLLLQAQAFHVGGPPGALSGEAGDQLRRRGQALFHERRLLLELRQLLVGRLVLLSQLGQVLLQGREHLLELCQFLVRLSLGLLHVLDLLAQRLDVLGDVVVLADGLHPDHHGVRGLGHALDAFHAQPGLRLAVLADVAHLLLGDAVLRVALEQVQQLRVAQHLLAFAPVLGIDPLARGPQHGHEHDGGSDELRGVRERLQLRHGVLVQILQSGGRGFHGRQSLHEGLVGLGRLHLDDLRHLRGFGLLHTGLLLLLGGHLGLLLDDADELRDVGGLGVDHDLLLRQVLLHAIHGVRRLDQLGEAALKPGDVALHRAGAGGQLLAVVGDEVQVVLGGDGVVAPQLLREARGKGQHLLVRVDHVPHELVEVLLREVVFLDEVRRHALERLRRPGEEPVDGRAGHQAREVAAAHAQLLAAGRHAQDDVQVVPRLVDVVSPAHLRRLHQARLGHLLAHAAHQAVLLVLRVERRRHPDRQHVVEELEETLLGDVCVGEQEHHFLLPQLLVQLLEVLAELRLAVVAHERDLEHVVASAERRDLGQALLAAATHADQQRVSPGHADDAVNAREVLQRLLEQHQVERLLLGVVNLQHHVEDVAHGVVGAKVLVQSGVFAILTETPGRQAVVSEDDGVRRRGGGLVVAEAAAQDAGDLGVDHVSVGGGGESIAEHPEALVAPQAHDLRPGLDDVLGGKAHALVHARQVAQRRRRELLDGGFDAVREGLEAPSGDGRVDGFQHGVGGVRQVEHVEERREARIDAVPAAARRPHGADVAAVLDVLDGEVLAAVVHAAAAHEEEQPRDGLLRAVRVHLGHVHVVDEDVERLARRRPKHAAGALVDVGLDGRLHVAAAVLDGERLGRAALAHEQHGLHRRQARQQLAVQHHVRGGHGDLVEAEGRRLLIGRDHGAPGQPALFLGLEELVVERAVGQPLATDTLHEGLEAAAAALHQRRAHGPHGAEHEHALRGRPHLLGGVHAVLREGPVGVQGRAQLLHHVDARDGDHLRQLLLRLAVDHAVQHVVDGGRDVALEQLEVEVLRVGRGALGHLHAVAEALAQPALVVRSEAEVLGVHPHHAAARDGGRRGVLEVEGLADHGAVGLEADALSVGEGEELVVVHNGVHVLHPQRVHVAVVDEPAHLVLAPGRQRLIQLAEDLA
eukprot:scaffold58_cov256-Pinguiococcus_pyrenoidosus.AAC.11